MVVTEREPVADTVSTRAAVKAAILV